MFGKKLEIFVAMVTHINEFSTAVSVLGWHSAAGISQ